MSNNLKFALLAGACASLIACNVGGTNSSDVQSVSTTSNGVTVSLKATGCRTMSMSNGSCSIQVTSFYSTSSSSTAQTFAVMLPANTYSISSNNNTCANQVYSTTSNSCSFTINSSNSSNSAQTVGVGYTSNGSSYPVTSFTVGGGT